MATPRDDQASLAAALIEFADARTAAMSAARKELGLTDTDAKALVFVIEHPDCRAGELTVHLDISSASTTTLIDRLVGRELIERRSAPGDRRGIRLHATASAMRPPWDQLAEFDGRLADSARGERGIADSADAVRNLTRRATG